MDLRGEGVTRVRIRLNVYIYIWDIYVYDYLFTPPSGHVTTFCQPRLGERDLCWLRRLSHSVLRGDAG